jgi:mannitol-specific phosphotransferase system IIBC component
MAYVSSWGEANPGGGLDVKAAYIERSRKEVEEAQRSLATIIHLLGMKVD